MAPPADERIWADVLNALVSHARLTGKPTVARIGEFKSPPPAGLSLAVWFARTGTAITGSGLAVTAGRALVTARLYYPLTGKTGEEATPEATIAAAGAAMLRRLNADLTLGGLIRNIDILGEQGDIAEWVYGYLTLDSKMHRVADLQIDCIINDVWPQAAT